MSTAFRMRMVGAAGLSLLMLAIPAAAADGTHRGEYLGTASSDSSTGTQPEEYGSPPAPKKEQKSAKPVPKVKVIGTPGTAASVMASQPAPKAPLPPPMDKQGRPIINMEKGPNGTASSDSARAKSADTVKKATKKPAR